MHTTHNINLGRGSLFTINDDAYRLLVEYINTLTSAFGDHPEGPELVEDIEIRIAEILNEETANGERIVTLNHIQDIIERIGNPQQMEEGEVEETTVISNEAGAVPPPPPTPGAIPPPFNEPEVKVKKRLYRDIDNKMVGGVCSGLAAYFNIDVSWIRLGWTAIALLSIFNSWFFLSIAGVLLVYVVLWIVLPAAKTPYQKMEMRGSAATFDNIGRSVTDDYARNNPQGNNGSSTNTFATVVGWILKFVILMVVFSLAVGLIGALTIFIIMFYAYVTAHAAVSEELVTYVTLAVVCIGISFIIPLALLCRSLFRDPLKLQPLSRGWRLSFLFTWMAGVVCSVLFIILSLNSGFTDILRQPDNPFFDNDQFEFEMIDESAGYSDIDSAEADTNSTADDSSDGIATTGRGEITVELPSISPRLVLPVLRAFQVH